MIGSRKLKTIREELHAATADLEDDPIRRLEESLGRSQRPGSAGAGESEVLQSLKRVLGGDGSRKERKAQARTKK